MCSDLVGATNQCQHMNPIDPHQAAAKPTHFSPLCFQASGTPGTEKLSKMGTPPPPTLQSLHGRHFPKNFLTKKWGNCTSVNGTAL